MCVCTVILAYILYADRRSLKVLFCMYMAYIGSLMISFTAYREKETSA